jgi:hypothetical protein
LEDKLPSTKDLIDARVRGAVYEAFLSNGQIASLRDHADALGLSLSEVRDAYRRLEQGHVLVLQPVSGEILMANPFSAVPTPFLVVAGGRSWWANCIWDALGILAMVAEDGQVRNSCPDCGEGLHLFVRNGELEDTSLVAHFLVPAKRWWDDIIHA